MTKHLFRLELYEDGETSAQYFTTRAAAMEAFEKAKKSVISAHLDLYDEEPYARIGTVVRFERR